MNVRSSQKNIKFQAREQSEITYQMAIYQQWPAFCDHPKGLAA